MRACGARVAMLTRPETRRSIQVAAEHARAPRAPGLLVARIVPEGAPGEAISLVAELDRATIDRIRRTALTMRARHAAPITIEVRYVPSPESDALIGPLGDLWSRNIRVVRGGETVSPEDGSNAARAGAARVDTSPADGPSTAVRPTETLPIDGAQSARDRPFTVEHAQPPSGAEHSHRVDAVRRSAVRPVSVDPFGVDIEYRRSWLAPLRFLFERYWRVEVSGIENVPRDGAALIAANHSGAIPVDAFMLAVALELHHPERRCLRVLYDKFVDALPWIGPLYNRLGGVPSSFANAELMLNRGEVLGIFPEGIAGVEKRWTDRYQLRPFKTGTARLSVATGAPIVPVAIVGAEEAYPVVARLYRVGQLLGVPWIPVTPFFPMVGLLGAVPLPTKWHVRFCRPVAPPTQVDDQEGVVAELTATVRRSIALALGDLLLTRRGVFF